MTNIRKRSLLIAVVFLIFVVLSFTSNLGPELLSNYIESELKNVLGSYYLPVVWGLYIISLVIITYFSYNFLLAPKKENSYIGSISEGSFNEIRTSLKSRYLKRIDSKLANEYPINIEVEYSRQGSPEKGHLYNKGLRINDLRAELFDIFEKSSGRLLIIGNPGSGKTVLLLQLAIKIIDEYNSKIPIVVDIATWQPRFSSINEWLIELLPQMGFSESLVISMIEDNAIIPLYDGLDELDANYRTDFLSCIDDYGIDHNSKYVICSRINEYTETDDASVFGQVRVKPLSLNQIKHSLRKENSVKNRRILDIIDANSTLARVIETPFYLNTIQLLFSSAKNWQNLSFSSNSIEECKKSIVDTFINETIENISKASKYTNYDDIQKPLAFLANRMNNKDLVTLELTDIQYDWVNLQDKQLWRYRFLTGLVRYLNYSPIVWVILMLIGAFKFYYQSNFIDLASIDYFVELTIESTIITLLIGLCISCFRPFYEKMKSTNYPLLVKHLNNHKKLEKDRIHNILRNFKYGIDKSIDQLSLEELKAIVEDLEGKEFGIARSQLIKILRKVVYSELERGWIYRKLSVVTRKFDSEEWNKLDREGLIQLVESAYRKNSNNNKILTKGNFRFSLSFKNSVETFFQVILFTFILCMIGYFIFFIIHEIYGRHFWKEEMLTLVYICSGLSLITILASKNIHISNPYLTIRKPYQRFSQSLRVFHFSILQHFYIRFIMFQNRLIPFKIVQFLNLMSRYSILEHESGSLWRFRHRILQDYFDKIWKKKYLEK